MLSLSNAGRRPFKKTPTPNWNEGESVLAINNTHFIFSNNLCEDLNITDNNVLTFIYQDNNIYLANITSLITNTTDVRYETADGILLKNECLRITNQKTTGEFKGARTAANKMLFTAYEKKGLIVGEYSVENLDNDAYPAVKIIINEPTDEVERTWISEDDQELSNEVETTNSEFTNQNNAW